MCLKSPDDKITSGRKSRVHGTTKPVKALATPASSELHKFRYTAVCSIDTLIGNCHYVHYLNILQINNILQQHGSQNRNLNTKVIEKSGRNRINKRCQIDCYMGN